MHHDCVQGQAWPPLPPVVAWLRDQYATGRKQFHELEVSDPKSPAHVHRLRRHEERTAELAKSMNRIASLTRTQDKEKTLRLPLPVKWRLKVEVHFTILISRSHCSRSLRTTATVMLGEQNVLASAGQVLDFVEHGPAPSLSLTGD